MSDVICNFSKTDFDELLSEQLTKAKDDNFDLTDLRAVLYTDGGSRKHGGVDYGGWGIHGYFYIPKETNSNSGCKKAVPTLSQYKSSKDVKNDKAYVLAYLDYYGKITSDSTNNIAEATAMLRCLFMLSKFKVPSATIHSDSKYVLELLQNKDKYQENGFLRSDGKPLANLELCRQLIEMYEEACETVDIEVTWVKGHSGDFGNDTADANATKGCFLAGNDIRNIKIRTDDSVRTPLSDGTEYIFIANPDDYFDTDTEAARMLSENCLFFTTNGIDIRNHNTYYQASFGKNVTGKDKDERRMLRGKPFADCCISVVELRKPDPVVNNIINIVADNFQTTGVVECNLSYQTRQAVYSELLNGGLNTVRVDNDKGRVEFSSSEELASLINPVRQSFKLINDFNAVKNFLDVYVKDDPSALDTIIDVTSYFYEKKESKSKITYKAIEHDDGFIEIPVEINVNGKTKTTHIPITIGVDTPSKLSLGRMKTIEPTVKLVTWETLERTLRFAILIETTEGIGVWMGIYSNTHLH